MPRLALLAFLLAAPAMAAGLEGEAKLAAMLQGRTAGPPRSCIPLQRDNQSHVIEGIGTVFDVGATRYVNRFQGGCRQLTTFTTSVTRTPTTQLCEGDIADVVTSASPMVPVGSCIYGKFTPYQRTR